MTTIDHEAIRRRAEAATPGPWNCHDFGTPGQEEPSSIVVHAGEFNWRELYEDGESAIAWMPGWDSDHAADAEFIAHAREDVPALLALVDELLTELDGRDEAARERWADKMMEETKLLHMDFRNGATMTLELAKDLAAAMVAAAKPLLVNAPNYSETIAMGPFGIDGERERYTFVVQRVGKLTPHEARQQAEARATEAEAEVRRLQAGQAAVLDLIDDSQMCEPDIDSECLGCRVRGAFAGQTPEENP